jgi:hypothetical protein
MALSGVGSDILQSAFSVAMDTHMRSPSTDRVVYWTSRAETSFDLFDALKWNELVNKTVECPICLTQFSHRKP